MSCRQGSSGSIMTSEPKFVPRTGIDPSAGRYGGFRYAWWTVWIRGLKASWRNGQGTCWLQRRGSIMRNDDRAAGGHAGHSRTFHHRSCCDDRRPPSAKYSAGRLCSGRRARHKRSLRHTMAKPFIVLLNCISQIQTPPERWQGAGKIHGVTVIRATVLSFTRMWRRADTSAALSEFPVEQLRIFLPEWSDACWITSSRFAILRREGVGGITCAPSRTLPPWLRLP